MTEICACPTTPFHFWSVVDESESAEPTACRRLYSVNPWVEQELHVGATLLRDLPHYGQKTVVATASREHGPDKVLITYPDHRYMTLKQMWMTMRNVAQYVRHVIDFYPCVLYTFHGLVKLGIVYNNTSIDTLHVRTTRQYLPVLINFSKSVHWPTDASNPWVKRALTSYEPHMFTRPMEHHLLSFMYANRFSSLSAHQIRRVLSDVYAKHAWFQEWLSSPSIIQYYCENWQNVSASDALSRECEYEKTNATWDQYALSATFIRIFTDIHRTSQCTFPLLSAYMNMMMLCLHPIPTRRPSIAATMASYAAITQCAVVQDFQTILNGLAR